MFGGGFLVGEVGGVGTVGGAEGTELGGVVGVPEGCGDVQRGRDVGVDV